MSISRSNIFALARCQLYEFSRDFGTIFLNLVFPLLFVLVLLLSDLSNPSFKLQIGIIDQAQTHSAQEFVQTLISNSGLEVTNIQLEEANNAIVSGDQHVVVVIKSAEFEANSGDIELIVGDRYKEFSKIMLDAVRDRMSAEIGADQIYTYNIVSPDQEVHSEFMFTFPGMLAFAMVQLGLFATAVPLLHARDRGTLIYLSLSPLSKIEMLLGQLIVRIFIAIFQLIMILAVGSLKLQLDLSNWVELLTVSILGATLMVSIGYAIAGVARSLQMGMAIILILNFSMLMGGNVFSDVRETTFQYIVACINPVSFLSDLYRQVITGLPGVWSIGTNVLIIFCWICIAVTISLLTFKFDMNDRAKKTKKNFATNMRAI